MAELAELAEEQQAAENSAPWQRESTWGTRKKRENNWGECGKTLEIGERCEKTRRFGEHIGKLGEDLVNNWEALVGDCQNPRENLQNTCGNCEHVAGFVFET